MKPNLKIRSVITLVLAGNIFEREAHSKGGGEAVVTGGDALAAQAGQVVQPLALHVRGAIAEDIRHRGVGVLQPSHQPLGPAVALEQVAP